MPITSQSKKAIKKTAMRITNVEAVDLLNELKLIIFDSASLEAFLSREANVSALKIDLEIVAAEIDDILLLSNEDLEGDDAKERIIEAILKVYEVFSKYGTGEFGLLSSSNSKIQELVNYFKDIYVNEMQGDPEVYNEEQAKHPIDSLTFYSKDIQYYLPINQPHTEPVPVADYSNYINSINWELQYPLNLTSIFKINQLNIVLTNNGFSDGIGSDVIELENIRIPVSQIIGSVGLSIMVGMDGYLFAFKDAHGNPAFEMFNMLNHPNLTNLTAKAFIGRFNISDANAGSTVLSCINEKYKFTYNNSRGKENALVVVSAMSVSLARQYLWLEANEYGISSDLSRELLFNVQANPQKANIMMRNVGNGNLIPLGQYGYASDVTSPFFPANTIVDKNLAAGKYYSRIGAYVFGNNDGKFTGSVQPAANQIGKVASCGLSYYFKSELFSELDPKKGGRTIKMWNYVKDPNDPSWGDPNEGRFKLPLTISDCYQLKHYLNANPSYLSAATVGPYTDPAVANYPAGSHACIRADQTADVERVKAQLPAYLNFISNKIYLDNDLASAVAAEKLKKVAVFDFPSEPDTGSRVGFPHVQFQAVQVATDPNLNYKFS